MVRAADEHELILYVSDTSGFTMELFDDVDEPEELSSATRASFAIKESIEATVDILSLTTGGGGLTIDTASNTIAATLTPAQANGLPFGSFIASLDVEFGASNWKQSDRFIVQIFRPVAQNLP